MPKLYSLDADITILCRLVYTPGEEDPDSEETVTTTAVVADFAGVAVDELHRCGLATLTVTHVDLDDNEDEFFVGGLRRLAQPVAIHVPTDRVAAIQDVPLLGPG